MSRRELVETLPPKPLADRLVVRFWESLDPSVPRMFMALFLNDTLEPVTHLLAVIIHKPTFLKTYENSWTSLVSIPLPRLGLIFAVLCLALQSYQRDGEEPVDLQGYTSGMTDLYRQRAAQCILASDFVSSVQDCMQCFLVYGICEYSRLSDGDASMWMVHSLIVRKAMLMGYHRDPDSFPSVTTFDGEMRRRIWHSICQLDLLLSFNLGLPSMIQYSTTDVAAPRSLFEEELHEDMAHLPPSRPPSEPTPIWYLIGKQLIFQVFADVVQHLNSIKVPSDNEVFELNQRLADVYGGLPDHLKMQPWEKSYMDSPALKVQRMQLRSFYDKVICVLNRRFIAVPRTRSQFAQSRKLCIQSALSLLSIQSMMHQAGSKWWALSLMRNDFLLATVIICLVVYTRKKATKKGNQGQSDTEMSDSEDVEVAEALDVARDIWTEISDLVPDAHRACKIIDSMQQKAQAPEAIAHPPGTEQKTPQDQISGPALTPESLQDVQASMLDWAPWDSLMQGTNFEGFENWDELWGTQPT